MTAGRYSGILRLKTVSPSQERSEAGCQMNALIFSEYLTGGEELTARASRAQPATRLECGDYLPDHADRC